MSNSFVRRVERTLITILVILISIMVLNIATSCNTKSFNYYSTILGKLDSVSILKNRYKKEYDEIVKSYNSGIYNMEQALHLKHMNRRNYMMELRRLKSEIDSLDSLSHKK